MTFVVPAVWLFRSVGQQNTYPLTATPSANGTVGARPTPESALAAAASALIASPPQIQPGRYQFVAVEQWARSGDGISPRRIQHWRATDGSGRIVTAVLPTLDTEAFRTVSVGHTDFSAATVTAQDYPAGQLPETLHNPSGDPQILLQQLHTIEPADNGPAGVLRAVASLYDYANPDPQVRAAALNVLAGVDGLVINDRAIDPLGRPGIAITARSTTSTDTLIIDPRTGLALALRQTYTLRNLAPALHQHLIYLQSGRTDMLEPVQGHNHTPTSPRLLRSLKAIRIVCSTKESNDSEFPQLASRSPARTASGGTQIGDDKRRPHTGPTPDRRAQHL